MLTVPVAALPISESAEILKPAATPKTPQSPAVDPPAPHKVPAPQSPCSPVHSQSHANAAIHKAQDRSLSAAQHPSPPSCPAPRKTPPHPKYRPSPETPIQWFRQISAAASRPSSAPRRKAPPPSPTRESAPRFSSGECTPAFLRQSVFPRPQYPPSVRQPCRSQSPPRWLLPSTSPRAAPRPP